MAAATATANVIEGQARADRDELAATAIKLKRAANASANPAAAFITAQATLRALITTQKARRRVLEGNN